MSRGVGLWMDRIGGGGSGGRAADPVGKDLSVFGITGLMSGISCLTAGGGRLARGCLG